MEQLRLGVIGASCKPDEHRLAIHPAHLGRIEGDLRRRMFCERGYGQRFGVSDAELGAMVGSVRAREPLLEQCDVVVLAKPFANDLRACHPGRSRGDGRIASRTRASRRRLSTAV